MDSREATATLSALVRVGVAEAIGAGGGRAYRLADALDRRADAAEHVPERARSTSKPRIRGARAANAAAVREVLERGPATLAELATATALSSRQVHYALQLLREQGSVVIAGGRGTYTVYRLTGNAAQA